MYRIGSDDDGAFEECEFDVGVSVEFETDRIVEFNVVQPDFYDDRNTSSTIEQSIYIGVDEARKLAKGLQTAIERAEQELARRKATPPLRATGVKARSDVSRREKDEIEEAPSNATKGSGAASTPTSPPPAPRVELTSKDSSRAKTKDRRSGQMLAATLRELGRSR